MEDAKLCVDYHSLAKTQHCVRGVFDKLKRYKSIQRNLTHINQVISPISNRKTSKTFSGLIRPMEDISTVQNKFGAVFVLVILMFVKGSGSAN